MARPFVSTRRVVELIRALSLVAALALFTPAIAVPVLYNFSTGPALPTGGSTAPSLANQAIADALAAMFAGSTVSGSFMYDPAVPLSATNPDGSVRYNSSFNALSAAVTGGAVGSSYAISDPLGFTVLGNDTFGCAGCTKTDMFQFFADSSSAAAGTHNIVPFIIGDFSLFNLRMFWIEGQSVPEMIDDFLTSDLLLGAPPGMHGRLALDFVKTGETAGTQFVVFFDSLGVSRASSVPEPGALALLAIALLALGWDSLRARPSRLST